jgi:ATP-binding cassette subfamily F protein 3
MGVNVLILDEPTNHLDLWACESLEQALLAFEGTVIVVSHDRYFLNRVADLLIVFADGTTEVVYGNYDTYELLRQSRNGVTGNGKRETIGRKPEAGDKKQESDGKPAKRKRKFPYRKVHDLEADIAATERKIAALETAMQTPDVYKDATRVRDTMKELEQSKDALARLYQHWEEAVELNG